MIFIIKWENQLEFAKLPKKKEGKKKIAWLIEMLILTVCEPIEGYLMLKD